MKDDIKHLFEIITRQRPHKIPQENMRDAVDTYLIMNNVGMNNIKKHDSSDEEYKDIPF